MTCTVLPLADLDPELPFLAAATDPGHVCRLFAASPPPAPPGTTVLGCDRVHTDYEPGVRCLVSYRLRLAADGVEPWSTYGGVQAGPAGLTTWWYTDDPALPTLGAAADASSMRAWVASWAEHQVEACSVAPMWYQAGVGSLLRYEALTPGGPRVVFGKLYGRDAERHARTHAALQATLDVERRAGASRPQVPRLVGYLPDLALVAEAAVAGPSLHALVFGTSADLAGRLRLLSDLGGQLAGFHASAGVPGPVRSLADDLAELAGYRSALALVDQVLAERLASTTALAEAVPCRDDPPAPAHGALRLDRVLLGADGIVLANLDDVGWADPARDVGSLLAHLAWRALRRPAERTLVAQARAAFLAGYRNRFPDLDEASHRRYEAVALLEIAGRRFRTLQYEQWRLVPDLLDLAAATLPRARRSAARHSPAMASALAAVTDPARMTTELRALPWGRDGSGPPTVQSAELLAYRAERTAVVQYHLAGGPGRHETVLGKLYGEPGMAVRAHAVLSRLAGALSGAAGGRVVPEPIGVLPSLGLLVFVPVHGRFFEALGSEDAEQAARAAARWLARLHGSSAVLDRRLDLRMEQANVRAWARAVEAHLPSASGPAQALAARLAAALDRIRVRLDVPIHKDFHYQHVLVGSRLAVIDFDEARMGDPSLDVAHFCVCLDLLALRGSVSVAAVRAAFLEEYAEHRGWQPDSAYPVFSAWTCLKIAKQLATGRGPRPRPVGPERLRLAGHMLAGGLSWLS